MTDHYSEFRQPPPEDEVTMKIEITQRKEIMRFAKTVTRKEVNELIERVLDGEAIYRDDGQQISIDEFVSGDLLHRCEGDVIELLKGNSARMEYIEIKMREVFKDQIEMMFMDYGVQIDE